MFDRLRRALIGAPKNLFDPRIHQHLALMAFFAWVGLGSDGLSSSSYGPEEIYRQLGTHHALALYLAVAVMATVFLISASYRQIIEQFPSGGGGYLVATKLLGPAPGVVSGCALVIDYVLTISISIAAGCEAIFSFLPLHYMPYKLPAEFVVLGALVLLNLRGVKESVYVLTPIFLVFIATHAGLVLFGILRHAGGIAPLAAGTLRETSTTAATLGLGGMAVLLLRAFSLGGGTFTGIEAVSNGVAILREPRVENGKRTMLYMASSLAFTAGGILLCYLLNDVRFETGRTLNASLWSRLAGGWTVGGIPTGVWLVGITLISEGALLFVAAQTGFVDGPRTLAAMATDEWVPRRFKNLSERLVTQDGVLGMAIAAGVVLAYTRGAVDLLVVMYSINVFLTFTLSQGGMSLHWVQLRDRGPWKRRFFIAALGTLVTGTILAVTVTLKFEQGGWVTLLATGCLIAVCFAIRRHYRSVREHLRLLDDTLLDVPLPEAPAADRPRSGGPTAIVLVESYSGLGVHTFLWIHRLFPERFHDVVFVSVGLVDSAQFKGAQEMGALERKVQESLARYVDLARRMGFHAESRYALGIDVAETLEELCAGIAAEVAQPVVFAGRLVFERERPLTRSLHDETAYSLQRRLLFRGIQVIILPVRVWESVGSPPGRVGVETAARPERTTRHRRSATAES
ncbi:MAG TPA: APC family permease [Candidatus Omnitrophota bacterium]|nr:APC family permease [Candidatus Omnitrophota bacterium]